MDETLSQADFPKSRAKVYVDEGLWGDRILYKGWLITNAFTFTKELPLGCLKV